MTENSKKLHPIIRLWVDALRSGKYFQHRGVLRQQMIVNPETGSFFGPAQESQPVPDGLTVVSCFCVQGVLMNELDPQGWVRRGDNSFAHAKYGVCHFPSEKTLSLGLHPDVTRLALSLNDEEPSYSFEQLAEWLETKGQQIQDEYEARKANFGY